jgi:tetratricopeptide (TPR) repeat protein
VKASLDTGRFEQAKSAGRALTAAVEATGHRPLIAELGNLIGEAEGGAGAPADARRTLEHAVWEAEASRHDQLAARIWTTLVYVVGYSLGDPAAAEFLIQRADAALLRIGDPARPRGELEMNLGTLAYKGGDVASAIAHWERAVASLPVEDPTRAGAYGNLGLAYARAGRDADATVALGHTAAIFNERYGPTHPRTLIARFNLANRELQTGALAAALRDHQAVLADRETILGAEHIDLAHSLNSLAWTRLELGHLDEAAAAVERAAAIVGARGEAWPSIRNTSAAVRLAQGKIDAARDEARAALALHAAGAKGPGSGDPANVHEVLANIELAAGNWRAAEAEAREAMAAHEKTRGPDSPMLAAALTSAARARIELGDVDGATPLVARAVALAAKQSPLVVARAALVQARLDWRTGRHAEARAIVDAARAALTAAGLADDALASRELAAWLDAHP